MTKSTVTNTSFAATRTDDGQIELHVNVEGLHFVLDRIPDGQMAGMMGHRQEEWHHDETYRLGRAQARDLWEQLGDALGER